MKARRIWTGVRFLTLDSTSQKLAYQEHIAILDAIAARDGDAAAYCMREHLSRIRTLVGTLKGRNHGLVHRRRHLMQFAAIDGSMVERYKMVLLDEV